jgi:transposase
MDALTNRPLLQEGRALTADGAAQGTRMATGYAPSTAAPDPEVVTAKRRQFSAAEKRRLLNAADRCTKLGELGALLPRERIYSSMLVAWRKQRAQDEEAALEARQRGRRPDAVQAEERKVRQLPHENEGLRRRLAEAHVEVKGTLRRVRTAERRRAREIELMDAVERLRPRRRSSGPLSAARTSPRASAAPRTRAFCQRFVHGYNTAHRHSGIGSLTPETVHFGRATEVRQLHAAARNAAFARTPHRFTGVAPPRSLPTAVWINPPEKEAASTTAAGLH